MVQNFAVFADRSVATKIRTMKSLTSTYYRYGLLVGVVSPECRCEISSEATPSAKFCTGKKFPAIRYIKSRHTDYG